MEEAGFDIAYHAFGERRANLIARTGGNSGKLALCFTGHIDTVPLGLQPWSVDPFAADISGNKLYGRGSSDMKSGVAALMLNLGRHDAVRRLVQEHHLRVRNQAPPDHKHLLLAAAHGTGVLRESLLEPREIAEYLFQAVLLAPTRGKP